MNLRPVLCLVVLCACGAPVAVEPDSGAPPVDSGVPDAGPVDAGPPDAGARVLCPKDGGWISLAPMPGPRSEVGVAALNGEVYVAGGYDQAGFVVATVQAYSWRTNSWRAVASLPRVLNHVNLFSYSGKLWALGALDQSFRAVGSSWLYDPAADGWTALPSMPAGTERGGGALGIIDGKLIIAGGYRLGAQRDVSLYDTSLDMWVALPQLPAARDHLVGGVLGNTFFAIGGRRGAIDGRVDALTLGETAWVGKTPMLTPRAGAAAAQIGNVVIVAGGEGNGAVASGIFPQVEAYDLSTDTWSTLPSWPTLRHGTGGVTIDDVAFFPVGAIREGLGAVGANEAWCPPQ